MVEYKTLYEISMLLNSEQDVRTLIRLAVDKVIESTQAQRGMLLIADASGRFAFECARTADRTDIAKPDSQISRTVIQSVMESGKTLVIGNALADPKFKASSSVRDLHLLSIACAPLRNDDETFGVIYIDNRSLAALFNDTTRTLLDELSRIISVPVINSLSLRELLEQQRHLQIELAEQKGYDRLIGASPAMTNVLSLVNQVADSDATVLITGESGTGKELIARQIHQKSSRSLKELVVLDCSAIAENLLEAELFGHVKGAFTGADTNKPGWFEIADKSSIFLDEIGEMSPAAQKKLLRLIQFGDYTPVGSKKKKNADVRLIIATNRNLEQMVKEGAFREDLYYRINVIALNLPPLRERREDIVELADYFLKRLAKENKKEITGLTEEAARLLRGYAYPGNIRELRNIIQYAVILCNSGIIGAKDLPLNLKPSSPCLPVNTTKFKEAKEQVVEKFEKAFLCERLAEAHGNVALAARNAGMYKKNFVDKLREYNIDPNQFKTRRT
jgi:transcriptional regulator with GAF, ATPase, and Fis domain